MKGTLAQRDFSVGEIRPDLWGDTDKPYYSKALKTCRNVWFNKAGKPVNAPGTDLIKPGKFPTKSIRLLPFKIAFNQQYLLEFGDKYMHVIKNGNPLFNFSSANINPPAITSFPNGANPTITIGVGSSNSFMTSSIFANGMLAQIQPTSLNTLLSTDFSENVLNRWVLLTNVSIGVNSTTFMVTDLNGNPLNSSTWGTYNNNLQMNTVFELATPYAYSDVGLLKYAQSFQVMQLRHGSYFPQELRFSGGLNWALTPKLYTPSQAPLTSNLSASGGASSTQPIYYKITTYNRQTRQESFPGSVGGTSLNTPQSVGLADMDFGSLSTTWAQVFTVSGNWNLTAGQNVVFNNTITSNSQNVFIAGKTYQVKSVSGNSALIFSETFTFNLLPFSVPSGTKLSSLVGASSVITAMSSTNPMIVTYSGADPFNDGDEVFIQNTGVQGIDGNVFNVTHLGAGQVTLNSVNGNNYNLATFVASQGQISETALVNTLAPTVANPVTISFKTSQNLSVLGIDFLVYSSPSKGGPYGFIGKALQPSATGTGTFLDQGIPPDTTKQPKNFIPLFYGTGNYPSNCNYYQQRLVEMATNNNPQGLWASVVGDGNDFSIHNPQLASDAILLNVWSNELQQIFDSADCGHLILMTDLGPMLAQGDATGEFTPGTPLIKKQLFAGSAQQPRPLSIYKSIVYLEASQSCARDLQIEIIYGLYVVIQKSDQISLLSEHLFQQSPVIDWDYKLYPDTQILMVRQDGKLIFNTYGPNEGLNSYSWGDSIGTYNAVACVQEGTETMAYVGVIRNGAQLIERFHTRYYIDSNVDAVFEHSTINYNGRAAFNGTVAIAAASWNANQTCTVTLTGTLVNYTPAQGDQWNLTDGNGNYCRIIYQSGGGPFTCTLMETPPIAMQNASGLIAALAIQTISGLWHLNGLMVSVVADGKVVANPNDTGVAKLTVQNGQVTLGQPYGCIHIGLPYLTDIKLLDVDNTKGETMTDKLKAAFRPTLKLLNTGDVLVGPDFQENLPPTMFMDHPKLRQLEGYDAPTNLFTGILQVNMDARFDFQGNVAIRNNQPLPFELLSVQPLMEVQS